jgi:ATP-dependent Clp protease protease subunit
MNLNPLGYSTQSVIPGVVESGPRGERMWDLYSMLLKERIIMLFTAINDQVANTIVAQLLYLDREDPDKDINMYIQSPGGQVTSGLAIYDTMQLVHCPVSTICVGMAASMATVLLCAGNKGKRFALPHATVHMHQALGGTQGQVSDILIEAKEILRLNDLIKGILSNHTGQPLEKITHDIDRDYYLDAEAAKEYGLIDEVLTKPIDEKEAKGKK